MFFHLDRATGQPSLWYWDRKAPAVAALCGSELPEVAEADIEAGWYENDRRRRPTLASRAHPPPRPAAMRDINTELGRLRELFHAGQLPS